MPRYLLCDAAYINRFKKQEHRAKFPCITEFGFGSSVLGLESFFAQTMITFKTKVSLLFKDSSRFFTFLATAANAVPLTFWFCYTDYLTLKMFCFFLNTSCVSYINRGANFYWPSENRLRYMRFLPLASTKKYFVHALKMLSSCLLCTGRWFCL